MTVSPPCPTCHSTKTAILTTGHRNDPLWYCRSCKHFWRPAPQDVDTARAEERRDGDTDEGGASNR
jgi:ribosomal protein L37AE/L43A